MSLWANSLVVCTSPTCLQFKDLRVILLAGFGYTETEM